MKLKMKMWLLGIVFGCFLLPVIAHADAGIVLNTHVIKNEKGDVIKVFSTDEKVHIQGKEGSDYIVDVNGLAYKIPNTVVLKTRKELEISFTVKEDSVGLYVNPSIFESSILRLKKGKVVHRLIEEENSMGDWIRVVTDDNVEGWVHQKYLQVNMVEEPVSTTAYIKSAITINGQKLNVADEVEVFDAYDGKFAILYNEKKYEISRSFITFQKPVVEIKETPTNTSSKEVDERTSQVKELLKYAYQELGKPYVWGAEGPRAYDCSGYTQSMLNKVGITLPRTAAEQSKEGVRVAKSSLEPGDLLFFTTYAPGASHVGIYVGDGKMIHAGGNRVQVSSIEKDYWVDRYLFAKRMNK